MYPRQFSPVRTILTALLLTVCFAVKGAGTAADNNNAAIFHYTVSLAAPSTHMMHIEMSCSGWPADTVLFRMPGWMPGYYQIMHYGKLVSGFTVIAGKGKNAAAVQNDESAWQVVVPARTPFRISYDVKAEKRFVANNFLDSTHAYIVPAATFMYVEGHLNIPVSVKVVNPDRWSSIATGLKSVSGKKDEFSAPDFDILYDCPILAGNLEELPSFTVGGVTHRFTGYKPGSFNREKFISDLARVVKAGTDLMGHIPYEDYIFLAIGPGMGGIEHLNNCTVSFNGTGLDNHETMMRTLNFLAHEYFHNYNVKRIRPFELGPFDYGIGNRTNLLWLSEGMTVYYEYLIVKRAGLKDAGELFRDFEGSIDAAFNDPGRAYQSLAQASYSTWDDGPFGQQGKDDRSISVYDKGAVMGLVLDFTIRNASSNKKSLDDVMRDLYNKYYRQAGRGFTDAEFREACEKTAGKPLTREFEYVYSTGDIDLATYLSYAGLQIRRDPVPGTEKYKFTISRIDNPGELQSEILSSWLGE